MKKVVAFFALLFSLNAFAEIVTVPIPGAPGLSVTVGTGSNALPLQYINQNPSAVNITTADDSYNEVPLGFGFPFFGKTFTRSWAMTNGLVTFQDPATSGLGGACCSGVDLSKTTDAQYNYTIYALHTDLYSWNGRNQFYLPGTNEITYGWYDVSQCCSNAGGNSFEVKINSTGLVDTRIAGALVRWNAVTSGMAGDLSKGEYYQYYHGQGIDVAPGAGFSWQAPNGTGNDLCLANPLISPACPGYAVAYLSQQCTISPLYNPSCPGYEVAYFTQQCSINQLYSPACPGYEKAYHDQQCSADPLYATDCPGYAEAYHKQQCTANALYATDCPGYAEAYAKKALLEQQSTASTAPVVQTTTAEPVVTPSSTGNTTVDKVIATTTTATTSAAAPAAAVQLVQQPVVATQPAAKEEKKDASTPSVSSSTTAASTSSETKADAKPTARQELQAKREAAAKAAAIEKGNALAGEMGKLATMEAQTQVQGAIIQAMGFTPGFDVYNRVQLKDVSGYKPYTVYNNQVNVDNRRVGLGLYGPSDRLHNALVDSQYKGN